jgi:flagellar protein FliO/FliZ
MLCPLLLLASTLLGAEEAPPLPESLQVATESYEGAFFKMMLSLFALIAIVFATFWVLRRLSQGKWRVGHSSGIRIVERRPLSAKSAVYVLEVDGKRILVSESQLEVRALATLTDSATPTEEGE